MSSDVCWCAFTSEIRYAASLGLEPRQRDPESLVLPLHHEAMSEKIKTDLRCRQVSLIPFAARFTRLEFSRRARSQRLRERLRLPMASRSSPPARARVPPFYRSSGRHDSDRDGKAGACEHLHQAPTKQRC